jgi:hypothetical protein
MTTVTCPEPVMVEEEGVTPTGLAYTPHFSSPMSWSLSSICAASGLEKIESTTNVKRV